MINWGLEEVVCAQKYVTAIVTDRFKKESYLCPDLLPAASGEKRMLIDSSDQRDTIPEFPSHFPWLLVTPYAGRCQCLRSICPVLNDRFLDAAGSATGVVGHLESQFMQSVVDLTIVWQAELSMEIG